MVFWGYQTIKGPDGTWAGRIYALIDNDSIFHGFGVLIGNEAYKGLIYAVSWTIPYRSPEGQIVGLIQPGAPPPDFPIAPLATP